MASQKTFIREIKYDDGVIQKDHYNLEKCPTGPILVELIYPDKYFPKEEMEIPKKKKKKKIKKK